MRGANPPQEIAKRMGIGAVAVFIAGGVLVAGNPTAGGVLILGGLFLTYAGLSAVHRTR